LAKLLAESNFKDLRINGVQRSEECVDMNKLDERITERRIEEKFASSNWYKDIVSYMLTFKCLSDLPPSKAKTLNLHAVKYYISKRKLYWKDPRGFLLVCLVESET
jgi:hypothetical protein